jgi:hypothetical protein
VRPISGPKAVATVARSGGLEFEEMIMLTFADDGRVVHQRGVVDNLRGLRQAGAIPSPRPAD